MKRLFLFCVNGLLAFVILLSVFVPEEAIGAPNPSVLHCLELGYDFSDQKGSCVFPNGSECNTWDFFRGKCGQDYSICGLLGYDTITVEVDYGTWTGVHGVCVFPDDSQCKVLDFFQGKCGQDYSICGLLGYDIITVTESSGDWIKDAVCIDKQTKEIVASVKELIKDPDDDGISNKEDNCPGFYFFNPDQEDTDGDGIGDVCDEPTTSSTSPSTTTSTLGDEFFIIVHPEIISRSRWVMLPAIMDIWCIDGDCNFPTRVRYEPKLSVLPMPPLVIGYITQLIFVMPAWLTGAHEETLTVTVTTEWGTASDTIEIRMGVVPQ